MTYKVYRENTSPGRRSLRFTRLESGGEIYDDGGIKIAFKKLSL